MKLVGFVLFVLFAALLMQGTNWMFAPMLVGVALVFRVPFQQERALTQRRPGPPPGY